MLSVFSQVIDGLPEPLEWRISNFCHVIFDELQKDPSLDVSVTQIRHYKEKENLGHEFLLADIVLSQGQRQCILRLERSTPPRQRRTFLEKLVQTSSSVLPALDTVRISASHKQLTDGLKRGPFFPVATLAFRQKPLSLREFCLILSFFPAFSPEYKLREEQCYWFCNVVLSTTAVACEGASIVEEKGFKKAGRLGRVSVTLSVSTRKLFIDAYTAIRTLGEDSESNVPSMELPPLETLPMLIALLDVPSTEARIRAAVTIAQLANSSPHHRTRLIENHAVPKLVSIVTSFPSSMMIPGMAALHALAGELWSQHIVGESWPQCLNGESANVKIAYLALASPANPDISEEIIHKHIMLLVSVDSVDCPVSTLFTSLALSTKSLIHCVAATSTFESHLGRIEPSVTHHWIVALSNALSSPLCTADVQRRITSFLIMALQDRTPSVPTLLQVNIRGMLMSQSKDLQELIIETLHWRLPSTELEKQLLNTGCLRILGQLIVTRRHDYWLLYIFSKVCQHYDGIHPYDSRLPGYLVHWLKETDHSFVRSCAHQVIAKFASSQRFSEEICDQGIPSVLARLVEIDRGGVAESICALSHWRSCRPVLFDAGLVPLGYDRYHGPINLEVVTAHLRRQ